MVIKWLLGSHRVTYLRMVLLKGEMLPSPFQAHIGAIISSLSLLTNSISGLGFEFGLRNRD